MSILGSIAAGVSSLIGPALQTGMQAYENEKNRQFNAEQAELARTFNAVEAQKERDWQEQMSNTAYQRALEDMEKAGINPAMAFSNGANGASSGAGASASASAGASATGQGTINVAGLIGSAADLARAFNGDKNTANDMNSKQLAETIKKLTYLIGQK